ncbi:MAG: type II toxin-antitoxin system PemK/MazF family toxin [Gemmatimonadetes bacterium]|nr:type II toxin-antitoxin system PemK/MazF family toxin [Gemmatimonadota bacterium]MBK7785089.1 type II toxin-antitoxin system PemK/MazF family toxin [Gemmatimonadota bacterium]
MVAERGTVVWGELPEPRGSEPGFRRPLLVIQADAFNRSRLPTVVTLTLSANLRLLDAPGNVLLPASATGLPRDSVANVSQIVTIDARYLREPLARLPGRLMDQVDDGLRLILNL